MSYTEFTQLAQCARQVSKEGYPEIDLLECMLRGDVYRITSVGNGQHSPFRSRPLAFSSEHKVQSGNESRTIILYGCDRYYETWALWPRPFEYLLRIPAACFDALTAVGQIPYYELRDFADTFMDYNRHYTVRNPWKRFDNPPHQHIPSLVDIGNHRMMMDEDMYDDIVYDLAKSRNDLSIYRGYLERFPSGRHARDIKQRIAELQASLDRREYEGSK
jgi:hypothetical protein